MTRHLRGLMAALAVGAMVTAAPSVAQVAAPDITPPTLNLPARGSFVEHFETLLSSDRTSPDQGVPGTSPGPP